MRPWPLTRHGSRFTVHFTEYPRKAGESAPRRSRSSLRSFQSVAEAALSSAAVANASLDQTVRITAAVVGATARRPKVTSASKRMSPSPARRR